MAQYCNSCTWTGQSLADAAAHAQAQPGHMTSELDPTQAEAQASQLEQQAAELLRQANELRRRAGLLADDDR